MTTPDPAAIDQLLISLEAEATMQAPRGVAVKLRQAIAAVEALRERVVDLERERDLAVAHDLQPYPTAAAYEAVCKACTKWQARVVALEGALEEIQKIIHAWANNKSLKAGELMPTIMDKAVDKALKAARQVCLLGMVAAPGPHFRWPDEYYIIFNKLDSALAALDALGKEKKNVQ